MRSERGSKDADMKTSQVALSIVAAVLIALLAGYVWGEAGRRAAEQALQASTLRVDLLEARGAILAARVDLYNVNFGNASRDLQSAIEHLQSISPRLKERGTADDQKWAAEAAAQADQAHRLAGKLDAGANAHAAEAATAIERILADAPR
jgi:hypothetical protein